MPRGQATGTVSTALVGRASELDALIGCLDQASAGRRAIAVIEGEAGMGKTRLLWAARDHALRQGFIVREGSTDELDSHRPFAAVGQLLDQVSPSAPRPPGSPARVTRPGHTPGEAPATTDPGRPAGGQRPAEPGSAPSLTRAQVVDGLTALINGTDRQPLALVVEDLQWADRCSLAALREVVLHTAEMPIALIFSRRATPETPELARFLATLHRAGARRLPLPPLVEASVAELATSVLGSSPGERLRHQLAGAGGNPLYILELLRSLGADAALTTSDGQAEIAQPYSPASLRVTLLGSISYLSPETLQLLRLASILGARFAATDLATVAGRRVSELVSLLREALAAEVLAEGPDGRLAFRHELIRDAIYTDLAPTIRRGLHRQAGEALSAVGAALGTVATQVALGTEPGDTRTIGWLREQAERAAAESPGLALELGRRALELAGPADPNRGPLIEALVRALLLSGRTEEARALSEEGLEDPLIDQQARERLRLPHIWALVRGGRPGQALDALGPLLDGPDSGDAAQLAAAYAQFRSGLVDRARELATSVVASTRDDDDASPAVGALCLLSHIDHQQGRVTAAIEKATRASELAGGDRAICAQWPFDLIRASALMDADRVDEAAAAIRRGQRLSESTGAGALLPLHHWKLAELLYLTGEWQEALTEIQTGLTVAGEDRVTLRAAAEALALRALIALHRDDFAGAEAALVEGETIRTNVGADPGMGWLLLTRARLEAARGDSERALSVADTAWRAGTVSMRPVTTPDLIGLLVAAGRAPAARRALEGVQSAAACIDSPPARAAALRCHGLLSQSGDHVVEATLLLRNGKRTPELASTCADAGLLLSKDERQRPFGVVLLEEACAIYDGLGAQRDVARVRAWLRTLGVATARRGSRHRSTHATGWESLTPAEERVAALVVEGLTSPAIARRLFVSRRTVETHISHVFAKLEINSRGALRAVARRRALAAPAQPTEATAARASL